MIRAPIAQHRALAEDQRALTPQLCRGPAHGRWKSSGEGAGADASWRVVGGEPFLSASMSWALALGLFQQRRIVSPSTGRCEILSGFVRVFPHPPLQVREVAPQILVMPLDYHVAS